MSARFHLYLIDIFVDFIKSFRLVTILLIDCSTQHFQDFENQGKLVHKLGLFMKYGIKGNAQSYSIHLSFQLIFKHLVYFEHSRNFPDLC